MKAKCACSQLHHIQATSMFLIIIFGRPESSWTCNIYISKSILCSSYWKQVKIYMYILYIHTSVYRCIYYFKILTNIYVYIYMYKLEVDFIFVRFRWLRPGNAKNILTRNLGRYLEWRLGLGRRGLGHAFFWEYFQNFCHLLLQGSHSAA